MSDFSWGLVGPGNIARQFADALRRLPGTHLQAVLGRDAQRASDFAARWTHDAARPVRVAPDLSTLLADPEVHAVYIATPHASHGDVLRACLEAGKPVLCEKPLLPCLAQALPLVALAREKQLFLMEALWTRFLPIYAVVRGWLQDDAIGPLRAIQSSFCFNVPFDARSRLFDPAQAGGSLLDIGIYNLAMTRWVLEASLGACPEPLRLHADAVLAPTGVDRRVAGSLIFPGGISAQFVCAFDASADNTLRIFGERGCITVQRDFWSATEALLERAGQPAQQASAPLRINGFEGEIEETMRCIRAGLVESPQMPHSESLALVTWIDAFRRQIGVRYPFE